MIQPMSMMAPTFNVVYGSAAESVFHRATRPMLLMHVAGEQAKRKVGVNLLGLYSSASSACSLCS